MVVLVAIEPRSYRQVIGQTIQALRPHVEVVVLAPDTLEAGVARLGPDLVFANRPDASAAPTGRPAWVEFRPYDEPPARVCLAGRRRELEAVELDDLLSLVDVAEEFSGRRTRATASLPSRLYSDLSDSLSSSALAIRLRSKPPLLAAP